MSTNYFNIPTYNPQSRVNPYAVTQLPPPISGQSAMDLINAGAPKNPDGTLMFDPSLSNMPNYAQRAYLAGQLGTGEGSIAARYNALRSARKTTAAAAVRGFGGIAFNQADDPNTPNIDESLSPTYESGRMGSNERDAYKAALAAGANKGINYSSGGEQLVGSALQRVSEQARAIIAQYSQDINGLATQQLNEQNAAVGNYGSLYGQDAATALSTVPPVKEPTVMSYTTKPVVDANLYNVVQGGNGMYYTLKIADFPTKWGAYKVAPNRKTLDNPKTGPGAGNYVIVKTATGWEVRVK